MSFFSGLKKAYDSFGSEVSKTFDSSYSEEGGSPAADHGLEPTTPKQTHDESQSSYYSTPLGKPKTSEVQNETVEESRKVKDDGDGWGKWEEQPKTAKHPVSPSNRAPAKSQTQMSQAKKEERQTVADGDKGDIRLDLKEERTYIDTSSQATPKSPIATSTPNKAASSVGQGKSQLDSLSHEDLIKYVKKQAQLLHKTKARCDELSKECDGLKKKPASSASVDGLMEELQVVRSERDKAVGEGKTLRQSSAILKQEKQNLTDQLSALEEAHSKLKQFFQEQQTQTNSHPALQHSHEVTKGELAEERKTTEQLKSELTSLREQLESSQANCSKMEKNISDLEEKSETFTRERNEVNEKDKVLREELEEVRSELVTTKETLESEVSGLQTEKDRLESRLDHLQEQLNDAQASLLLKAESVKVLELESVEEGSQRTKLEDLLHSKEQEIETLTSENERLNMSCESSKKESEIVEKLEAQVAASKAEKSSLESQVHNLGLKIQNQSSALESAQQQNTELEQAVESERERSNNLSEQLNEMNYKLDGLETTLENLHSENSRLNTELGAMESRQKEIIKEKEAADENVASLESELDRCKANGQKYAEELQVLTTERGNIRAEVSTLQQDLSGAKVKIETLLSENETLLSSKDQTDGDQTHLQSQYKSLQDAEVVLKQQLADSMRETEQAESEKDSLKKALEQQLADFTRQAEESEVEKDSLKQQIAELEIKAEESRAEKDTLKETLEQRLTDVRSQAEEARSERDSLKQGLEQQGVAHKEESKKLKAFIIKIKKELSESRERESTLKQQVEGIQAVDTKHEELLSQLETVTKERDELRGQLQQMSVTVEAHVQSLAENESEKSQVDELTAQLEALKSEVASLRSKETKTVETISKLSSEREELLIKLQTQAENHEVLQSELASVHSDLSTANAQVNTHRLATEKAQSEVASLKEELARQKESHVETKQKLETADKEAKSSALMNLELEDYQRSMKTLEDQLTKRTEQLEQSRREGKAHQETVSQLRKELDALGQQRSQSEETVTKLKQLLVKNKKEMAESKKKETELQEALSNLNVQLEEEKQASETAKVEISQLTATIQSIQQQSTSSSETLQCNIRTLEHKLSMVQGELAASQASLTQAQKDYDSYKVRVHSVLKQKSNEQGQAEASSEMRKKYETELMKVNSELQKTKSQLSSTLAEHEELLLEHDQLASRHDQLLQESEVSREKLKSQWREEETRYKAQNRDQKELISQLRSEIEEVTSAFKTQLHSLQAEHHKVVVGLKEELQTTHVELSRLQQEADAKVLARATEGGQQQQQQVSKRNSSMHIEIRAPPNEPRSSGEGMDQSELESTTSVPPTPFSREDSNISLERLLSLSATDEKTEKVTASEAKLQSQLHTALRKIKHLTELLRESEAGSVRFSDQAKLLKEEIRRLERNQEREQGVSNLEYLKNVVLKFLHTEGPERAGLIPVVTRLLQLSPQEIKFLQDTVKGDPSELPDAMGGEVGGKENKKGWSSYIHRWTGY